MNTKQRIAQKKFKKEYTLFSRLKSIFSRTPSKTRLYKMVKYDKRID